MKKALLLSVIACATAGAHAQSSVTLFGIVDATFMRGSGSIADRTQLGSNGLATTRLGFRGTEDLGGGLSASFWLEAALNVDNGTGAATNTNNQTTGAGVSPAGTQGMTFNRRSTVSLAGTWGEVRLGRDFAVTYYNHFAFDPFGNNGVGTSQTMGLGGPVAVRVSNSVNYFTPAGLGGFYGHAQYYFGENASNVGSTDKDGNGGGVRAGYRSGPLHVAFSHAATKYAQTATTGDIKTTNLGARYDIGAFAVMGGLYRDRVDQIGGNTGRGYQLAALYRTGPGEFRLGFTGYKQSVGAEPEAKKVALGYVHDLSKRTALYATYARVNNSGGSAVALNGATTAANSSSSGVDIGIRHSF